MLTAPLEASCSHTGNDYVLNHVHLRSHAGDNRDTTRFCGMAQSHNAMEVYTNPKDFISAQLVSTRDISAGPWNDWFTGE